ncbi:hypothetical protein, partial [Shigella sp. FC1967]|uniref:hypothetical protein n=1 Tax=Shigella sp. FC1967 TaxID=1898041 RepID=UPI000AC2C23F
GASITRRNGNRIYGPISFNANKTQFIPINDVYFIDKSGNKITMKWMYQGAIVEQGMTFENYIGLSNKRLTRLHLNAKTGASITRRNGNRIYGPISFNANKTQFIPINDVY